MYGITGKNRYGLMVVAGVAGILALSSPTLAQNRANGGGGLGHTVGGLGNAVGGAVGGLGGALGGAHVGVSANVGSVGVNSNTSLNGGGLNSNTTANVGNAVDAGVSASATRTTGVNANVSAGTPAVDADVTASLNGQTGVNANVSVNAPPSATDPGTPGTPGTPGAPGTGINIGNVSSQLSTMSRSQRIALKKRCSSILGSSGDYDGDLIKLCKMLARL